MEQKTSKYIDSFAGLRGLALIFVSLYHYFPLQVRGGYLGVIVFLTLSGYLVTDGFLKELSQSKRIDIWNFYKRRISRLYQPLLFFLFLISIPMVFIGQDMLYGYRGNLLSILFGYNNWWQISNNVPYFGQALRLNPFMHLWTLALELQFYLIWPWLLTLLLRGNVRRNRSGSALIILILSGVSAVLMPVLYLLTDNVTRVYYGTDTRLFSFLLGAVLAFAMNRKQIQVFYQILSKKSLHLFSWLPFLLMFVLFCFLPGDQGFAYFGGMLIFNICLIIVMAVAAGRKSPLGRFLCNPVLLFFGRRSYSLYLWQYGLMIIFEVALRKGKLSFLSSLLIQIPLLFLLAEISYRVFEAKPNKLFAYYNISTLKQKASWKKPGIILLTLLILFTCGSVLSAAITAKPGVHPHILEMQAQLEKNQMLLEAQNKKKRGENSEQQENEDSDPENTQKVNADGGQTGTLAGTEDSGGQGTASDFQGKETNQEPITEQTSEIKQMNLVPDNDLNKVFPDVLELFPELSFTTEESLLLGGVEITVMGDSIMTLVGNDLLSLSDNLYISGEKNRQVAAGISLLRELREEGILSHTIFFALGTNGVITMDDMDTLATEFSDCTIFIPTVVTPYDHEANVNAIIREATSKYSNLHLIEWYEFAKPLTDQYFYDDGEHPNVEGSRIYAQFMMKKIADGLMRQ